MKRFLLVIALAVLATAPVMAADAAAPMACCRAVGVERTVTNLDNGVKVTMTAKDPKAVAIIQEMSAACSTLPPGWHSSGLGFFGSQKIGEFN